MGSLLESEDIYEDLALECQRNECDLKKLSNDDDTSSTHTEVPSDPWFAEDELVPSCSVKNKNEFTSNNELDNFVSMIALQEFELKKKEIDLYSDLIVIENEKKKDEQNRDIEFEQLKKEVEKLRETDALKASRISELSAENSSLKKNICSLYKTAKSEIEHKDSLLAEANRKLDNFLFRKNGQNFSHGNFERNTVSEKYRKQSDGRKLDDKQTGDRKTLSNDRRSHPDDRRSHPDDRRAHLDGRRVHSGDRRAHPDDRRAHPDDRRAHPDDKRAHPDDRRAHLDDKKTHADDKATHLDNKRSHPDGKRAHPDDKRAFKRKIPEESSVSSQPEKEHASAVKSSRNQEFTPQSHSSIPKSSNCGALQRVASSNISLRTPDTVKEPSFSRDMTETNNLFFHLLPDFLKQSFNEYEQSQIVTLNKLKQAFINQYFNCDTNIQTPSIQGTPKRLKASSKLSLFNNSLQDTPSRNSSLLHTASTYRSDARNNFIQDDLPENACVNVNVKIDTNKLTKNMQKDLGSLFLYNKERIPFLDKRKFGLLKNGKELVPKCVL